MLRWHHRHKCAHLAHDLRPSNSSWQRHGHSTTRSWPLRLEEVGSQSSCTETEQTTLNKTWNINPFPPKKYHSSLYDWSKHIDFEKAIED
jgi:hypothetical protein